MRDTQRDPIAGMVPGRPGQRIDQDLRGLCRLPVARRIPYQCRLWGAGGLDDVSGFVDQMELDGVILFQRAQRLPVQYEVDLAVPVVDDVEAQETQIAVEIDTHGILNPGIFGPHEIVEVLRQVRRCGSSLQKQIAVLRFDKPEFFLRLNLIL